MPDSAACWLRCRSGRRIRSACVLAVASLVFWNMSVTQVVAQQPRRVGRPLVVDPCPPNNIFGVRTHDTLTKVLAERGWIQGQALAHPKLISDLALKYGIRVLAEHPQFAYGGALVSYGVDANEVQRPMAVQIDAILRG